MADETKRTGFAQLRADDWLDWHLLMAIHNVIINQRMRDEGIDWQSMADADRRRQLVFRPESDTSTPVALDMLTPQSLRAMMDTSVLAIGQRRWGPSAPTHTPNSRAFTKFLADRYGFGTDDVPHLDLLHEALDTQIGPGGRLNT